MVLQCRKVQNTLVESLGSVMLHSVATARALKKSTKRGLTRQVASLIIRAHPARFNPLQAANCHTSSCRYDSKQTAAT